MRFQPHSSSPGCPLPAPSQEQARVPLCFSPPLWQKSLLRPHFFWTILGSGIPQEGLIWLYQSTEHPNVPHGSPRAGEQTWGMLSLFLQLNIPVLPNHFGPTTVTQKIITSWGPQPQAESGSHYCGLSASTSYISGFQCPYSRRRALGTSAGPIPACGSMGSIPSHPNPLTKLPGESSQSGSYVFKILPSP